MAQSEYVVLRRLGSGRSWEQDPRIWKTSGAHQAIRQAAEAVATNGEPIAEGEFVAVPLRSWSPLNVGWEDVPRVKIGTQKADESPQEKAAAAA